MSFRFLTIENLVAKHERSRRKNLGSTQVIVPIHPFYPIDSEIVGYLENKLSVLQLLVAFAGGWAAILFVTNAMVTRHNPCLKRSDRLCILWFVLTGTIHFFFEGKEPIGVSYTAVPGLLLTFPGYFAYNHTRMAGMEDFFGQLWKEYSLSDSRYMTSDPFVLCMETITAMLWGPLSYCVAILITIDHPLRHPLQALVSTGQIYGDILYYSTSMFDLYYRGLDYCRPEPYYFWFYFVFMNFIWIVIPGLLLYVSVTKTATAFRAVGQFSKVLELKGLSKKQL